MINKIRVFYNPREKHEEIKKLLDRTGIEYFLIPTSGPYTLHLFNEKTNNCSAAHGPTQVIKVLENLIK